MLHIMICDDEPTQLALLDGLVKDWAKQRNIVPEIDLCKNADHFFFLWEEKKDADIVLLDIEMPGMDGMSLAKRLRSMGEGVQIIFVTGFVDYVLEGYDVDAVSYLLKPVKEERLYACLDKAKGRCGRKGPELLLESAGEIVKVKLSDICYLESAAHDTMAYCVDRTEAVRCKTGILQMERQLAQAGGVFFKIHRSYLINLAGIERITKKEVVMANGQSLPIARGKWDELNQAYLGYYRGRQAE